MISALVVDDHKENLYLFEALLKGHGYEVYTASNGEEALAQAKAEMPDIIISDILMPVMDGFTFCTKCKSDPQLKTIAFIFYTATYTDLKDENFALSLGADAFLVKPIEPIELMKRINEVVINHAQKVRKENGAAEEPQQVNLKEYNEVLIRKLEKKMAELDTVNKELQDSESRFRRLAENSPVLIYRVSLPEMSVSYINPFATELTGYSPEEFYHDRSHIDHYLFFPAWKNSLDEPIAQFLAGQANSCYEYQIAHKSGEKKWVQLRVVIVTNENRSPISIEGIIIDQTEHYLSRLALQESETRYRTLNEELEERVRERTAQLEVVNQELEAYSYSVSHDLRAPLRALNGFSEALIDNYHEILDDQGRHYLERIQEAAQRMGQLINDLLGLSRVTKIEFKRQTVDLSTLVQEITKNLQMQEPLRQVEITILPNIFVQGDGRLLKIALENLLNNAFKFTSKREKAQIQVGITDQGGERVYFVRDNGVGFDMNYASKLFAPFQRLHSVQEFPGTGIGLVTVQRIIHRHGGRIWAEAKENQSATFFFTLGSA